MNPDNDCFCVGETRPTNHNNESLPGRTIGKRILSRRLQGLYGDGAYLALASQDSSSLDAPNLSHFIYAYPEIRMIAHKQSLEERNLLDKNLVELVEIMDDEQFIQTIWDFDYMMIL